MGKRHRQKRAAGKSALRKVLIDFPRQLSFKDAKRIVERSLLDITEEEIVDALYDPHAEIVELKFDVRRLNSVSHSYNWSVNSVTGDITTEQVVPRGI